MSTLRKFRWRNMCGFSSAIMVEAARMMVRLSSSESGLRLSSETRSARETTSKSSKANWREAKINPEPGACGAARVGEKVRQRRRRHAGARRMKEAIVRDLGA